MHLFSYWSGPMGWMERLSIESIASAGHTLTVYTPGGTAISGPCLSGDAREVVDDPA